MRTPVIIFISLLISVGMASLTGYKLDPDTFAGFAFAIMLVALWVGLSVGLLALADKLLGKPHPWNT